MTTAFTILGLLHWLGLLLIVVGYFMSFSHGSIHPLMVWGGRLQLLIGLGLVGVLEMMGAEVNHVAVGIKLVLSIAVVAFAEIANSKAKKGQHRPAMVHISFAAAVLAALVGIFWMG